MSDAPLAGKFKNMAEPKKRRKNSTSDYKSTSISDIVSEPYKREKTKYKGFHLDIDVADAIDVAAGDKMGAKSRIVNEILKERLQKEGYID